MTETKLCKDCRHCMPEKEVQYYGLLYLRKRTVLKYDFARCGRPTESNGGEYVDQVPRYYFPFCNVERKYSAKDSCCPEAKFFEPI